MVRILLEVFILAFSFVFGGCSVCQIKNTVLNEKLIELCADVEWLFKSYEERIEYSLRPFLDNIKEDFKEYQELREKIFSSVEKLQLPRDPKQGIKEEEIENFLKKFFDPNKIGREEGAYIFAKEQVKETLKKLNSYYLEKGIPFQKGREKCQEDETVEQYINHIVFSIYIAKDTIEKKNKKSKEFISELSKLYKSEKGNVGGFVKLQQRKDDENYNNSVYNIDKLYEIFENFYAEGNVCVNSSDIIAEVFANAVVEFYNGKKVVDKGKQKKMFKKEIGLIRMDVTRTYPHFEEYFKEQEKYDEFKKILSKMLFFALFCIRLINEKEAFTSLSANDIIRELSGMQGLGEEQIQDVHKSMKNQSSTPFIAYWQGLNFFAGFFVILYFIVNKKFGGNVNNEEIIDGKKEIIDESKIIKLFVFYLLHKWDCDSSVNYLPSCSLYATQASLDDLPIIILLRRCKLLNMYTNYDFNKDLLSLAFGGSFHTCSLSRTTNGNDCLDYIMYLDLHLHIVKKKDINFYFDWFNFLYYKALHIIEKKDLEYYGYGPYTEIVKVLFSSDKSRSIGIEADFFNRKV